MVQTGAMGPTTVMGQIMGALNTGLAEDLNIETLDHGFDCNVDEVRAMDGAFLGNTQTTPNLKMFLLAFYQNIIYCSTNMVECSVSLFKCSMFE